MIAFILYNKGSLLLDIDSAFFGWLRITVTNRGLVTMRRAELSEPTTQGLNNTTSFFFLHHQQSLLRSGCPSCLSWKPLPPQPWGHDSIFFYAMKYMGFTTDTAVHRLFPSLGPWNKKTDQFHRAASLLYLQVHNSDIGDREHPKSDHQLAGYSSKNFKYASPIFPSHDSLIKH